MPPRTVERYARGVERMWQRGFGTSRILSRKDWELLLDWHDRGIPLNIVEEAVQAATERPTRGSSPRSLGYLAPAVEQAWQVIVDGRLEGATERTAASDPALEVLGRWRSRRDAEAAGSGLAGLLDELLGRAEAGESPEMLDRSLEQSLPEVAPEELLRRCRDEVDARLAPFESRMGPEALRVTRHRAWVELLRRALDLPRLRPEPDEK